MHASECFPGSRFGVKDESASRSFPILAGSIFGRNRGERKVAMTAPVTQRVAPVKTERTAPVTPVTQAAVPGGMWVPFVRPEGVTLESAPEPLDPRERLRLIPGSYRAATGRPSPVQVPGRRPTATNIGSNCKRPWLPVTWQFGASPSWRATTAS